VSEGVFFVTGISAAGKTTVGELLASRFPHGVHVKGDVFRRMIVSGRVPMRPGPSPEARRQLELRYRLGAQTADAYFDAGFTVVLQDIAVGEFLAPYVEALHGRPRHVVVLVPRVGVVAAREEARPKTAYRPDGVSMEELDTVLRTETPRIGLWLDNSDQTPDETVDEILVRKNEARV
jgi:hypothetical protein